MIKKELCKAPFLLEFNVNTAFSFIVMVVFVGFVLFVLLAFMRFVFVFVVAF